MLVAKVENELRMCFKAYDGSFIYHVVMNVPLRYVASIFEPCFTLVLQNFILTKYHVSTRREDCIAITHEEEKIAITIDVGNEEARGRWLFQILLSIPQSTLE